MKKSLLAIVAFATAITVSAATPFEVNSRSYTPTNASAIEVNGAVNNSVFAKRAKKAPAKVSSASDLAGTYIETNVPYSSGAYISAGSTAVTASGNTLTFKNFAGISDSYSVDVKATVDAAKGTFSIPAGSGVYKSSSYGTCLMYAVSVENGNLYRDTTASIDGVIQSDGSMVITTPWACFITSGSYAGYYISDLLFYRCFFNAPNATMKFTNASKGAISSPVYVEQTDSFAYVSNFAGYGVYVQVNKNEDSTVVVPRQEVLDAGSTNGVFHTLGFNTNTLSDSVANIPGTGVGHPAEIDLNNYWTLFSTTGYWFNYNSATRIYFSDANGGVSTDTFFTYPHELTGVKDVTAQKVVAGKHYVNLQGQVSNEPFEGVNIVVTRYTDGSQSATKVLK